MNREFVFAIREFKIRIDPLLLLTLPLMCITGFITEFLLAFVSIFLHELGHMITAAVLGQKISGIRVLPVGLNAQIEEVVPGRWAQLAVYFSGPFINILIFVTCLVLNAYYLFEPDNVRFFISVNVYLAFFNLIPVFPLDGGRILKGMLTGKVGLLHATKYTKSVSAVLSVILFVLGVIQLLNSINNFSLILLSIYIFFSLKSEGMEAAIMNIKNIIYRRSRLLKKGIYQARDLVVIKSVRLSEVLKSMDFDRFHIVYVLDDELRLIKVFTEQEIIDGMFKYNADLSFEELMGRMS